MKLINNFFKITATSNTEAEFIYTIQLNADHLVYLGHFPGHPVTPGVIQLQIVHELLEHQLGRKINLKTMLQCKFLKILNPIKTPEIDIRIQIEEKDEFIKLKALGEKGGAIFFKFSSSYNH